MPDSDHDIGFAKELGVLTGVLKGTNTRLNGLVAEMRTTQAIMRDNTNALHSRIGLIEKDMGEDISKLKTAFALLKGKLAVVSFVIAAGVSAAIAFGSRIFGAVVSRMAG